MKEKKVKILIAVMTASLIGVAFVQFYLIGKSLKIEEEKFDRNASYALMRATDKLEKRHAAEAVIKKFDDDHFIPPPDFGRDTAFVFEHGDDFDFDINVIVKDDSNRIKINARNIRKLPAHPTALWIQKVDTIIQKKLVANVLKDLLADRDSIENKLNKDEIEKSLKEELSDGSIETDFYFGVHKLNEDRLILVKEGADTTELIKSKYRAPLFPRRIFASPYELIVYFPDKDYYIFKSLALMLAMSFVFIAVIAYAFYLTVRMFIRQKKLTEVKNDLINNITHEFKTPISTISIACEALGDPELAVNEKIVIRYSGIVREENERLKRLVESLLTTAALEKNGGSSLNLVKKEVSIDDVVNECVKSFRERGRADNFSIETIGIPSGITINGDKYHLINVIGNLIDNAIKYNLRAPDIKISVSTNDDYCKVEVKDNGIGIPRNEIDKIFETFYRIPTGNIHNVRGNGLGLSYCKNIVELHGGKIKVESKPNEGSAFIILLPIAGKKS
ncbi:sensor protein RprX [Melioribacter roseus P3M-2]|uniref:histidine kinase n=1 Tax=Melioribacter roseus (strain DSM 23840 / JCM 17771 / VKM B-2668 / P3M-2) TaxID=1191523 RepID=I6Z5J7_MELRP|nr:sensor protein RprX [Melioribacter roseus P3M-2]